MTIEDADLEALYATITAFKVSGHDLYLRGFEDGKKAAIQLLQKFIREQGEMEEIKECCATCKHRERDNHVRDEYFCANDKSEHVADWVEPDDYCTAYEYKKPEKRRKRVRE